MALSRPSSSIDFSKTSAKSSSTIFGAQLRSFESEVKIQQTFSHSLKYRNKPTLTLKAVRESPALTKEMDDNKMESSVLTGKLSDHFVELKHRFLNFKNNTYLKHLERYRELAKDQAPKFMVISCGDSRVCPTSILGFQPGDAFVVRNVANLVPPHENGPTETNAALEFAVTALEVENIFVIGHSCCGGIKALMSLQEEAESSFIKNWVFIGKQAKAKTMSAASHLNFDQQCKHCEKESVNSSLMNLLSYPWIKERVTKGTLSIHGGYYDFVECSFEKWTLDYKATSSLANGGISIKDKEFWA